MKFRKLLIEIICYLGMQFYMLPFITVYIFDAFRRQVHDFWYYLDAVRIYERILHGQTYMIVYVSFSILLFLSVSRLLLDLVNRNEHGSARWADPHEIGRVFQKAALTKKGLRNHRSAGGMIIKKVGNTIWHECQAIHSIIIGTTSSGKTRKTLIPSIMITSEAVNTHTHRIRLIVKDEKQYRQWLKKQDRVKLYQKLNRIICHCVKRLLERILHMQFAEVKIIGCSMTLDLREYHIVHDLQDADVTYHCRSKKVSISEEGMLTAITPCRVRIQVRLTVYKESFLCNDPKKELYQTYRYYLEEKGYRVILLDFRKNWTGDTWNPMASVIRCIKEGYLDEADMYAQDIAASFCPETKMSDKIWTNGERSVIAALILAVADSDCPDEQKNMYTCYQILSVLGQPDEDDHVALNDYFNSLPVGDIARTAFGPASLATDRTRMSFYVSAAATLSVFSSKPVARQTASSSFDITRFSDEPTAVFVVNPDEKNTMTVLTSLFIDEVYRVLTLQANLYGGVLRRRFHNFCDEFASIKITDCSKRFAISRGRGILYHIYIQDFSQLEDIYGKEVAHTIKANCNLLIYISTQSLETAKEISEKIGNHTIETMSVSENSGGNIFINQQGNRSRSLMAQPLIDPNKLMMLPDGDAIVIRMRTNPIYTSLDDCSRYEFYRAMKKCTEEPMRTDPELIPYIPVWDSFDMGEIKLTMPGSRKL